MALRHVFFHIPKCAGSTVYIHLEKHLGRSRLDRMIGRKPSILLHTKHHSDHLHKMLPIARKARLVYGHFDWVTYKKMNPRTDDFMFTFLREPVDRLRSSYNFFCSPQGWKWIGLPGHPDDYTFEDYLKVDDESLHWQIDNVMVRTFSGSYDHVYQSDREWMEALEIAKTNIKKMSFIGFHHNFRSDFEELCKSIAIQSHQGAPENITSMRRLKGKIEVTPMLVQRTKWDKLLYSHALETVAQHKNDLG